MNIWKSFAFLFWEGIWNVKWLLGLYIDCSFFLYWKITLNWGHFWLKNFLWFLFFFLFLFLFFFCILCCFCLCVCLPIVGTYCDVYELKRRRIIEWKIIELNIDFTQPWPERRKNCAQDIQKSNPSTPARRNSDQSVELRRSIASSSSIVTVTRTVSNASTVKSKQRPGIKQRRLPSVHVKLAEEFIPTEICDSDSSCYNSLNEMETGSYMLSIFFSRYILVINMPLFIISSDSTTKPIYHLPYSFQTINAIVCYFSLMLIDASCFIYLQFCILVVHNSTIFHSISKTQVHYSWILPKKK